MTRLLLPPHRFPAFGILPLTSFKLAVLVYTKASKFSKFDSVNAVKFIKIIANIATQPRSTDAVFFPAVTSLSSYIHTLNLISPIYVNEYLIFDNKRLLSRALALKRSIRGSSFRQTTFRLKHARQYSKVFF